jgi:hypothetical protein
LPLPRLVASTLMEPAPLVSTLLPPVSTKASPLALALPTLARMVMLPPPALSVEAPEIFTALLLELTDVGATAPRIVISPPLVLSVAPLIATPEVPVRLVLA